MPSSYFPLRWESTGDQWWYASPIEWAAAKGHYDLVRELLHLDSNLLIKLTSLRRIRRLETVWDDEAQFSNAAKCRSQVARKLFLESETTLGDNSLICAGYGGWLLYIAASAGDVGFTKELLERDALLVFGVGEYGVSDIFYAASRSKVSEVFRVLFDFSSSPRCLMSSHGESVQHSGEAPSIFKWEMMNRAVHAAARGGNLEILKELLEDCSDVSVYRDVHGSTILHSASGRGQTEVVKDLVASFDIITSTDNQGNTALHVAAFHGQVAVVEALVLSSPSSVNLRNYSGDTFLHMAVAGFQIPSFRMLDRHIELMKHLVFGKCVKMQDIINVRNNDGRTALHTAVIGNINSNLVEILMSVPWIDINIHDVDGLTPLDVVRQQSQSLPSEILIKHLISGGGITNCQEYKARSTIVSHLKMQGMECSPGTAFKIPDAKIFLYTCVEPLVASERLSPCSRDLMDCSNNSDNKRQASVNNARRRLKSLLSWSRRKSSVGGEEPADSNMKYSDLKGTYNETLSIRNDLSSPSTKKNFPIVQAIPHITSLSQSPCTSFSRSSRCWPVPLDKHKVIHTRHEVAGPSCSSLSFNETMDMSNKSASTSKRLMDRYFCFSEQDIIADSQSWGSQQK